MRRAACGASSGWHPWRRSWAFAVRALVWMALVADIGFLALITLPMAPVNSATWNFASKINGDLREEIGWPELVETVAKIRNSLPPEDRAHLGIIGTNYGEAGAINLYGPAIDCPRHSAASIRSGSAAMAIRHRKRSSSSEHPSASSIAVSRLPACRAYLESLWRGNEETADHPDIFVCHGPRTSWPEFWNDFRYYGFVRPADRAASRDAARFLDTSVCGC